jgi:hypothetical protein
MHNVMTDVKNLRIKKDKNSDRTNFYAPTVHESIFMMSLSA